MVLHRPVRVLYVVYWGLAEPLGQSLVLPAIERLAALGVQLTVVTFEKPADAAQPERMERLRQHLADRGVRWIALRYHKRPRIPATALDILHGCVRGVGERVRGAFDVIHARTYIGGLIGAVLAPMTGARLIFHNEGFYPDEQVDGGFWPKNSPAHRIAGRLERWMYARADGLIGLSHRAVEVIEQLPTVRRRGTPVIMVPSCVDLVRFAGAPPRRPEPGAPIRLVYIGTIGGRYIFDKIARFVAEARRVLGAIELRVLTRADAAYVRSLLAAAGVPEESYTIGSVPHEEMPRALAESQAGLFFLSWGLSEHGCSPTKIGEYWAMGLPVVTTARVSDTDAIIERERVGVVISEHTDEAYRRAAWELRVLLDDPGLAARCRRAAESHYDLAPACDRQVELYHRVRDGTPRASRNAGSAALSPR